jgi:Leucine-rich repeat (LRR) protein
MATTSFFWALFFVIVSRGDTTLYKRVFSSLTAIPSKIPSSITEIELGYNRLSEIRQSDFNDKFPDLVKLKLYHNSIARIERGCFKGTKLQSLGVGSNPLRVFPDCSEVADTLLDLGLMECNITTIPSEAVKILVNLKELRLGDNPLLVISDQLLHLSNLMDFNLQDSTLPCCSDQAWIKGTSANTLDLTCAMGSSLAELKWDDVSKEELLQESCGKFIQHWATNCMCSHGT